MTHVLAAHLRLMEQLRERIRTHHATFQISQCGIKFTTSNLHSLKQRLEQCFAQGMNRKDACRELGTTNKTIIRLFGPLRPQVSTKNLTAEERAALKERIEQYMAQGMARTRACAIAGTNYRTFVRLFGYVPGRKRACTSK